VSGPASRLLLDKIPALWERIWFTPIPPHSFALLRILFGVMGLVSLAGLTPVEMYWPMDGVVPLSGDGFGPRAWLQRSGFGVPAGWAFFFAMVLVFTAMTVGLRSDLAVLAGYFGMLLQIHWNRLPLSSAHQVMQVVLFCLLWARTGLVWSLDARRQRGEAAGSNEPPRVEIWPLQLIRFQVALIYGSSGLFKILNPPWRDGSAVHWALNLNSFHRFPWPVPPEADIVLSLATWGTLLFELLFPILVWPRLTRWPILIAGVGLHLGLWLTLELGPFSWVMLASYAAFLDPYQVPRLAAFVSARRRTSVLRESA
jgi:hypothetical protein